MLRMFPVFTIDLNYIALLNCLPQKQVLQIQLCLQACHKAAT